MNSSAPYIIGKNDDGAKVKKYRRRRVYVLNVSKIVLFSLALLLLFSAAFGFFLYKYHIKYTIPEDTYYYLQLAFSENGAVATERASEITDKGGAGYVLNDNGFRVMANVYSRKSDAEEVFSRYSASYSDAEIYEMKIPSLNLKKYMEKNLAKQIYPIYLCLESELFDSLQKLDFSLGRGELSEAAVLKAVFDIKNEIKDKRLKLTELKEEYPANAALNLIMDFNDNVTGILDTLFPANDFTVGNKLKLALCMLCCLYGETTVFFQKM